MKNEQNPFAIIIVGAVMLLLGILVGYFGRPLIADTVPETTVSEPVAADSEATATPEAPEAAAEATPPPPTAAPEAPEAAAAPEAAPAAPAEEEVPPPPSEEDMEALTEFLASETRHFKGDPDAPVTIIEFSDFMCGFCGRFANETAPRIDEAYIESGQVRLGYYHFAFLGEQSVWAAEASECAADQDAFWQYHDALFAMSDRDFSHDNLKALAAELDLDTETFNECLDEGKHTDTVQNQGVSAQTLGVQSTPTFLVNGQPVIGAQPFDVFAQVIEGELE